MLTFMHKVHRVAMDIMSCLAIGLGLPEDFYLQVQHTILSFLFFVFFSFLCFLFFSLLFFSFLFFSFLFFSFLFFSFLSFLFFSFPVFFSFLFLSAVALDCFCITCCPCLLHDAPELCELFLLAHACAASVTV